jgi:hypothetical protein
MGIKTHVVLLEANLCARRMSHNLANTSYRLEFPSRTKEYRAKF